MKFSFLFIFILLVFNEMNVMAQASWEYTIWFNLTDSSGKLMSKEDYLSNKICLKTYADGAHLEHRLEYDTLTDSFKFSQHTIASVSVLIFVQDNVSTILEINTQNMFLDTVPLTGYNYELFRVRNDSTFICDQSLLGYSDRIICRNGVSLDNFINDKREVIILEKLTKVKLK